MAICERELQGAKATWRLVMNKHAKFYIIMPDGSEHLYCCGLTVNGGKRSVENTRAGIRRLLRQLGLLVK